MVYIIDDDEVVRDGLGSLVRSVGNQARLYGSTSTFLTDQRPEVPSCLVLDVRLPEISGLDFQDALFRQGIGIPVILMTGYGDIQMSVRGMKAGAVDFLTKPFRPQDALDAISAALRKDRERRKGDAQLALLRYRLDALTPRERQVIGYVTAGLTNKQIARELDLSEITVKIHRGAVMKKMEAQSLADLVKMTEALRAAMVIEDVPLKRIKLITPP